MVIDILVGTTSGNTEFLADMLHEELKQRGHSVRFHDNPQLNDLPTNDGFWLICVATHGAGEVADSMLDLNDQLQQQQPSLKGVQGAILSVGDSSYDTFCQAGKDIEHVVVGLGVHLISPRFDIDMMTSSDPEQSAVNWLQSWASKLGS
ncbi:flavodoxin domain-containing protein [Aliidiomarina soli]|uniref:Flavodoxin-like domain-containing protein n=1 Tax=Aliidiomarina soli TaxID=1928574 RepID=A0A432WIQ7_9GAMM|nr:flavodoxin domain-containing protein [Aliidiomarina soli]RUO33648.1 hypothetical protein CWE14_04060 [Aliidiomarina soli]